MTSPACPEGVPPLGLGACPACVAERTRWDEAYTQARDDAAARREWADRGREVRDEEYAEAMARRGWTR